MVAEQPSDGDSGPDARQVVRSPDSAAVQEYGGMEVLENLPLPAEEVERHREESADEETPQESVVDGASAEHLLGPKGSPEDGRGKEDVGTRTSELVLLVNRANIGDPRHQVVENSRADES